ncbi:MAG: DUF512 domain-containing protein [Clostridia bacterium]|nr:DUF512 domain-containing protein [Clostridia bacterium]
MPKIKTLSKFAKLKGLKEGDDIINIGGYPFVDILDYLFYDNEKEFNVTFIRNGKEKTIKIKKKETQSLGLEFDLEIEPIRCKNKCVFCFVDQLPKNLRDTLYVKDDDYRLSFISGSYVTMTNVSEEELQRIIRLKLSPLYISVHAFDDELRFKMLKNPATKNLINIMKRLGDAGIKMHTQLVIVPEMNDGKELEKSIVGLHGINGVETVAVVPVGLTGHRDGLSNIRLVNKEEANISIDMVEKLNKEYGGNFCWCSDEYYLIAEREMPDYSSYGDFEQIGNGVGMVASFDDNFNSTLENADFTLDKKLLFITGQSFAPLLEKYAHTLDAKIGTKSVVKGIQNDFFGHSVTVAGLVTGRDIIAQTKGIIADVAIVPDNMLREFTTTFLDDTTLDDVSKALNMKIIKVAHDGSDLVEKLANIK